MSIAKLFLALGSLNAMLAVILGAFGAHGLKSRLTIDLLTTFNTGVQYHFYHALGLIAVGLIAMHLPVTSWLKWSGWLMFAGIVIFSGSLYVLSIFNMRWLGMVTPVGGLAFIIAWLTLVMAIIKS
jgi:uncharacterized membrane protein YgdD (TMEM256/DUF423 family)